MRNALYFLIPPLLFSGLSLAQEKPNPLDGRDDIHPEAFIQKSEGIWETEWKETNFPFDEAVYSWNIRIPEGEGFRMYIRLGFTYKISPWLYSGFWGKVKPRGEFIETAFEAGELQQDHILLKEKARSYQFKVVSEGDTALSILPSVHVVYTDNTPGAEKSAQHKSQKKPLKGIVLDLPFRLQCDSQGQYIPETCQSTALSTAMEYFGKKINLEDIVKWTRDPEYEMYGLWPRTLGAAAQFGFTSYIDRFRNWDDVKAALAENKVILASITMPENDIYLDPPYPRMGGHIVALNGVTDDGRVVVTDSALGKNRKGYRLQWVQQDFEKIWMRNKGGLGMVICPPKGAAMKTVNDLPPFPSYKNTQLETKSP